MVGTLVGFAVFMLLLLLAVQTLLHLYAQSALTSAANEAADDVALAGGSPAAVAGAQAAAVARLGTFGARHTRFEWVEVDGDEVVLRVVAESPALLPLPGSYRQLTRTVTVRTERFR